MEYSEQLKQFCFYIFLFRNLEMMSTMANTLTLRMKLIATLTLMKEMSLTATKRRTPLDAKVEL